MDPRGIDSAFRLQIPVAKAWEGSEGELLFEGVASSTAVDRQRERMSPEAIRKMSTFTGLELLPSHEAEALRELGVVEQCWVDNDRFYVRGSLDKSNPGSWRLYERIRAGKKYGLSVGGRVTAAHWEEDEAVEGRVRVIDDVELDHVALCSPGQSANPQTYLSVMAKAADELTAEDGDRTAPRETGEGAGAADGATNEDARKRSRVLRLIRALAEARKLRWPRSGKGEAGEKSANTTTDMLFAEELGVVRAELAALREQLEELAQDAEPEEEDVVAKTCGCGDPDAGGTDVVSAEDPPASGTGKQSIDGQETRSSRTGATWKGVL